MPAGAGKEELHFPGELRQGSIQLLIFVSLSYPTCACASGFGDSFQVILCLGCWILAAGGNQLCAIAS